MSSVLSRDIDAYQRALDQYNRSLRRYNSQVDRYNQTLVTGPDGQPVVVDQGYGIVQGALPPGQTANTYGRTPIDGQAGMYVLRQNPISSSTETLRDVRYQQPMVDESGPAGGDYYYQVTGSDPEGGEIRSRLGPEWRMVEQTASGEAQQDSRYTVQRDNSTYLDKPAAWTREFKKKAPSPTKAEYVRAQMPSLAAIEGGLIGEVLTGSGLKSGPPIRQRTAARTGP
jgi:hypothetical protein